MLRRSPQPVREIASRLGYSSTAAFSTAFRKDGGRQPHGLPAGGWRPDAGIEVLEAGDYCHERPETATLIIQLSRTDKLD
jgi:AraC-like DNA-binding protein